MLEKMILREQCIAQVQDAFEKGCPKRMANAYRTWMKLPMWFAIPFYEEISKSVIFDICRGAYIHGY